MANKVDFKINDSKTEYIIIGRRDQEFQQGEYMEVEDYKFKRVSYFKYLGSIISQYNDLKIEVNNRLQI